MEYKKYLVKKNKLDLLSSLKALNKELLDKTLKETGINSILELKNAIIEKFRECLDISKDDEFTRLYFERLINYENSQWMSVYQEDIENFLVFVYKNGDHYSYYIPTEIKDIIIEILGNINEKEKI